VQKSAHGAGKFIKEQRKADIGDYRTERSAAADKHRIIGKVLSPRDHRSDVGTNCFKAAHGSLWRTESSPGHTFRRHKLPEAIAPCDKLCPIGWGYEKGRRDTFGASNFQIDL
jgi:hypothetical protein